MNNNQLFPFERNRYYAGKMLTSADFLAEQTYFNSKERFFNSLMYGSGIVCGCGVFSLDDLSILVESGVAIDGQGRQIVLDSSVVKKLSAVEGFDSLRTNQASLCLKYVEEPVHTVYSINQTDPEKEYEYNRIKEGYQLFLMDTEDIPASFEMETEFLTSGVIVESEDYIAEILIPSVVCKDRPVKLVVRVRNLTGADKRFSLDAVLQVPAFTTPEGGYEVHVVIDDILLDKDEVFEKGYWMTAQDTVVLDTNILLKSGSARAYVDGNTVSVSSGFSLKTAIMDVKPRELVNRQIGRMSLEMKNAGNSEDYIRLADLRLVRTDTAYIIEEVLENDVKKYVTVPSQEMLRESYMEYFVKEAELTGGTERIQTGESAERAELRLGDIPEVATGIVEIPLGENARKGDICYSGEIMHGLGKGNVYVEVGYEYIAEDKSLGTNAKSTIYGCADLFENEHINLINAETAVKVLNDKGSFVVAARLKENVDFLVLTFRWVAIRFPAGNDIGMAADYSGKSISAETPTVVLGTKESHFFGVRYHNMDSCSITYELTEAGSGEITSDGVYTAPTKEGVYEIRIYCTDMPIICTYAYAIVKKKGYDDGEEA
ncbi:MAG: hypothetical protein SOY45_07955 [Lachnospiraceae bacterium]|nr:hypothetical protein [Lachnospiraceae bacterium]MDY4069796.1 hypothetical protein [Lachnospiraceae bacterium]